MMRLAAALLAVAVVAAACGGGDDDDDDGGVSTETPTATATTSPTASATSTPSGTATPPPTAVAGEPTVINSSDGLLVIVGLEDAIPAGETVTIEAYTDGAQWPQELVGAFALGRVYELGPPGLQLDGPLNVSLSLEARVFFGPPADFADNVYLLMLVDGEWRALDGLEAKASEGSLLLTAQTEDVGVLAAVFGETVDTVVDRLNDRRAALGD